MNVLCSILSLEFELLLPGHALGYTVFVDPSNENTNLANRTLVIEGIFDLDGLKDFIKWRNDLLNSEPCKAEAESSKSRILGIFPICFRSIIHYDCAGPKENVRKL